MKKTINQMIFLCLIGILACEKNSNDTIIKDYTYSACKDNLKESDETESIHLKTLTNNQLLIEHINAYFNCEPGKILVKGEIINANQINIYEDEEQHIADCICRYDLNYKIVGVTLGENTITIFQNGFERLVYNIYLSNQTDTLLQVTPI